MFKTIDWERKLLEERENELDLLETMLDQGKSIEEIMESTHVDAHTVVMRMLDLGVMPSDIFW